MPAGTRELRDFDSTPRHPRRTVLALIGSAGVAGVATSPACAAGVIANGR